MTDIEAGSGPETLSTSKVSTKKKFRYHPFSVEGILKNETNRRFEKDSITTSQVTQISGDYLVTFTISYVTTTVLASRSNMAGLQSWDRTLLWQDKRPKGFWASPKY